MTTPQVYPPCPDWCQADHTRKLIRDDEASCGFRVHFRRVGPYVEVVRRDAPGAPYPGVVAMEVDLDPFDRPMDKATETGLLDCMTLAAMVTEGRISPAEIDAELAVAA